ncbi:hypothetical protein LguiA_025556 [Lonicera macranthoides]
MRSSSDIAITIQESAGSQSQKKDENKREKRSRDTDTDVDGDGDGDGVHQPQPQPLLVRCSSSEDKVKNKKKKQQELIPMTATITKNISITKTITLTTPPEDPETDVCLYLCLFKGSNPDGHCYRWCKIDLTNQSPKSKSKSKPTFLPPISYMPTTTPNKFCVVASSDSGPFSKKDTTHKKLVYAVGGLDKNQPPPYRSAKAFVCDFGSESLTWEELPPMSSPKMIHFGIVSPSDGKLYACGDAQKEEVQVHPIQHRTKFQYVAEGDIFDPASRSWTSCPPPCCYNVSSVRVQDYAFDKEQNKLVVFINSDYVLSFDLTTLVWRTNLHRVHLTPQSYGAVSSSVVVGDTLYKYHLGQLYALDKTSPSPSFELVPGLTKKVDSYMRSTECVYKSYLSYLGKGKFALVWGGPSFRARSNRDAVFISCLTFWVGVCNQTNRRHVLIDQRQEYFANGPFLHDCVALKFVLLSVSGLQVLLLPPLLDLLKA